MARRTSYEESPEDLADAKLRFDKRLQDAQDKQDKISARLLHRTQALAAGIPKSFLPTPTQVKGMDDATWNSHTDRWSRMGFHGVDADGRLLPAPQRSPLVIPRVSPAQVATELSGKTPLRSMQEGAARARAAAGIAPVVEVPGVGRTTVPTGPLNEFSTTPADARAIAARYGDPGTAKTTFSKAADRVPFIAGADGVNVGPAIAAKVSQKDPTLAPTVLQPEQANTIASAPGRTQINALGGIPKTPDFSAEPPVIPTFGAQPINTDLTRPGQAIAQAPSAAELAGASTRQFISDIPAKFRAADAAVATDRPRGELPRDTPIVDLPGVIGDFTRGLFKGDAGASRSQVARIQQPTQDNPVPVTSTTPPATPGDSKGALEKFVNVVDDEDRKKYAFAGF
jgi:hypothetical protein